MHEHHTMPSNINIHTYTDPNPVQYDFILDGGRSNQLITLINNGPTPLTLQSIRFTTNANIQSPWQIFGQQWANVQITKNNNFFTYTLNLTSPISLQPRMTTKVLEYSITNTGNIGPLPAVAMCPKQIEIQLQGQSAWQTINLTNSNFQPNPHPKFLLTEYIASWGGYDEYKQTVATAAWPYLNGATYSFPCTFDIEGNFSPLDDWANQLELPLLSVQAKRLPYLRSSLSFGGWTNNDQPMAPIFSQMAANPAARKNFISNAVNAIIQTGTNGIDIDWEYVEPKDVANYLAFLQELRAALPQGARLTIASPAGIDKIQVFTPEQWQQIASVTDEIRVMSYDYFGGFSQTADFHAPWKLSTVSPNFNSGYYTQKTLDTYQQMGVPPEKLSLGIPNYARSMLVKDPGPYAGLYQPITGTPQGDFPGANGVYSWNSIYNLLNNQPSTLDQLGVKTWHYYGPTHPFCTDAKMCLLSGQQPDGQWVVINFLDQASANWRAQQAKQLGLGGAMMWANYFDTLNLDNSIVKAVSQGLGTEKQLTATTHDLETEKQLTAKAPINTHINYLKEAYFAEKKHNILSRLAKTNNIIVMEKIIADHKEELGKHRNIFKKFLSTILPKSTSELLFSKPQSLKLAEQMLAKSKDALPKPTRIIETSALTQTTTSYANITHSMPGPNNNLGFSPEFSGSHQENDFAKPVSTSSSSVNKNWPSFLSARPALPAGYQVQPFVSTLRNMSGSNNTMPTPSAPSFDDRTTSVTASSLSVNKSSQPSFFPPAAPIVPSGYQRSSSTPLSSSPKK